MTLFILLALAATDVSPVDPSRPGKTAWGTFSDGGVALRTVQEAGAGTGITGQVSVNIVDAGASLNVNFPATQAVSSIDGGALATDAQLALVVAELLNGAVVKVTNLPPPPARNPLTGAAKVDGSGAVQPISAAVLPLPPNAAQEDGGMLGVISAQLAAPQMTGITFVQQPLNPFLLRCNPVRRTNCQP